MIPYARQSLDEEDIAAVVDVLRSPYLTQGPAVPAFEDAVARRVNARYAVATANATAALHLAMLALGVEADDLVWTSPNSFVASANCALYCGARVDFVDIDPRTYNICPVELAARLEFASAAGRLPKVLIPVAFAGQPSALDEIVALARRYGVRVVLDASHAIGASYDAIPVGSPAFADITVFSFHPVKIVTTGEGGMAVTDDPALAERLRLLRSHGVTRDAKHLGDADGSWAYRQIALGFNYRLTDVAAALGSSQLRKLDRFVERRRAIAARYDELLADLPVVPPWQGPRGASSFHLYPVRVPRRGAFNRETVYRAFHDAGITVNVHYIPIHTQPFYRERGFAKGDFPNAEAYYSEAVSLPMYADLSDDEVREVVRVLQQTAAAAEVRGIS